MAERAQFEGLLDTWDESFPSLSQADREAVLLGWADSPEVGPRAAFQALRKGILLSYYCLPHMGEGPNPVDEALGYPGPLGPPADPPPKTLSPLAIDADTELDCDVVVVGSGAGGGTAAGVLASAGLDVVVVEAGGYFSEEDFDGAELSGYARMYLNGGGVATDDQSIGLLAGSCLGGGTIVNYTWSFRPPDFVRADWTERFGLSDWAGQDFDDSLDAVWERLSISSESSIPSARDHAMRSGLEKLGWHSEAMQRNCKGCTEEVCRLCHYGCQIGAKQSTMKTWLQDAADNGARIVVNAPVGRVLVEGGRACGVEALTLGGHRLTVRARAVALAAGAIHTPAIMVRSGLQGPAVGKNLMLHPVLITWGVFDEEVRPWEGTLGATFSDEFLDMGEGYGIKYEHAATPPSILAIFAPWRGSRESAELMQSLRYTAGYGALQRARDGGEIVVGSDGLPVARWELSEFDRDVMRRGLDGAAQILEAGGARKIFSSHAGWVSYEPGRNGGRVLAARGGRSLRLGAGAGDARVVPPDGHGPDGLVALGLRVLVGWRDVGHEGPLRRRRRRDPDRAGREPDGHDRGGGAQDRAGDGCFARLSFPAVAGGPVVIALSADLLARCARSFARLLCGSLWLRSAARG